MRLFAGDRIYNIIERFKIPDDQPMEAGILSKQIENAQKKVEEQNFVTRKNVLKYDDVMNTQRDGDLRAAPPRARGRGPLRGDQELDRRGRRAARRRCTPRPSTPTTGISTRSCRRCTRSTAREITADELREDWTRRPRGARSRSSSRTRGSEYAAKEEELGAELMRELERFVVLQVVDTRWREHLENMDYLREGVHLRAMAQKDPLVEYRSEGHAMFQELGRQIREEVADAPLPRAARAARRPRSCSRAGRRRRRRALATSTSRWPARTRSRRRRSAAATAREHRARGGGAGRHAAARHGRVEKVGRNDPCPCGSGKKYKKCHGA